MCIWFITNKFPRVNKESRVS